MKDEEMAEEIANKRCHEIGCFGHCNFSSPKHHRCGEWHREYNCALDGYHEGFKDCAKSRLNVTTISDCTIKDEWHYVKDGEYPKDEKDLLMSDQLILLTRMKGTDNLNISIGQYNFSTQEFSYPHFVGLTDVIAWQEIVLPKEIE